MNLNRSVSRFSEVSQYLSPRLSKTLDLLKDEHKEKIEEIRLRLNKPLSVTLPNGNKFIKENGNLSQGFEGCLIASFDDIRDTIHSLCNMSIYSHQNQIKNGYITLRGGHRAGICGTAVVDEKAITNIRDISSVNIRIAREIIGSSNQIYNALFKDNQTEGCLIASPPCGGKTTLLRDLARSISLSGKRIAVVDERGELGAAFEGVQQNDLGPLTDLLDGYPKAAGIKYAVRSLSPDVIICDEIGDEDDLEAVLEGMKLGVPFILTAHAREINDLRGRKSILTMLSCGAIKNLVLLNGPENPGSIKRIYKVGELID